MSFLLGREVGDDPHAVGIAGVLTAAIPVRAARRRKVRLFMLDSRLDDLAGQAPKRKHKRAWAPAQFPRTFPFLLFPLQHIIARFFVMGGTTIKSPFRMATLLGQGPQQRPEGLPGPPP